MPCINIYDKTKEDNLVYPLIDLMFHTMEKIAYALLLVNIKNYDGTHSKIRKDFIKQFAGHSAFKEMVEKYSKNL